MAASSFPLSHRLRRVALRGSTVGALRTQVIPPRHALCEAVLGRIRFRTRRDLQCKHPGAAAKGEAGTVMGRRRRQRATVERKESELGR
jgi:hypothetical protein